MKTSTDLLIPDDEKPRSNSGPTGITAALSAYSAGAGAPDGGSTWNTTLYDALNRPTSVTDSGEGTLAFSYYANDVLRTLSPAPSGENPKKAQSQYDGLGRLQSVCEITSATGTGVCGQNSAATGFLTSYTYDTLNDLKTVSQSGQGRTYGYDSLSRLTSEANPESGTTSYVYDTDSTCAAVYAGPYNGDLVKRVDAVGNVTCYAYDAIHRLTCVDYKSGSYAGVTPTKTFVYDSATVNGWRWRRLRDDSPRLTRAVPVPRPPTWASAITRAGI